jgi:glycosyltransferase involved in cell wall biosynthesis
VFCGRLVAQKNVEGLLRGWAASRAARTRRLRIVGDGPLRSSLEALARELGFDGSVTFEDRIADARPTIAGARALVLFSHAEGLSNALLEALAAGTPVIASDVAGNAELIRNGETGLLVPAGDEQSLAAGIDRLDGDDVLAERLSAAGRELVRARYDIDAVARRVHALYERVLEQ